MAQAKVLSQSSAEQKNPEIPLDIADSMARNHLFVDVSNSAGNHEVTSIADLISDAKQKGRSVIITTMSGPFLKKDGLPASWMDTRCARGCTPQGNAFEGAMKENMFPQTDVFVLNIHPIAYQISLLEEKQWPHLRTIAFLIDEDVTFEHYKKELNIPTITVDGKEYLARFSVAVKPDGKTKLFTLESPVNDEIAKRHIESIAEFLKAELSAEKKPETPKPF